MNRYIALQKIISLGSFSKAAEEMGYSQSAASQMIASLEKELGVRLIHRSRYGVTLTLEGKKLYPKIEQLIAAYQSVIEKSNEIKGLETGTIRMGTVSSVSAHWLPGVIKEFQKEYPKVEFVIHQGDYSSIQEWIKNGTVDFGFINPAASKDIQTEEIKRGEMVAVLPENHQLAKEKILTLYQLAEEPFILLEEGNYSEPLEAFRKAGLRPDIKFTIHDDYSIMAMVEAGLGISMLAELVLHRTNYKIAVRHTEPPVYRILSIGYKDKTLLPVAARRFIDCLKKQSDQFL